MFQNIKKKQNPVAELKIKIKEGEKTKNKTNRLGIVIGVCVIQKFLINLKTEISLKFVSNFSIIKFK